MPLAFPAARAASVCLVSIVFFGIAACRGGGGEAPARAGVDSELSEGSRQLLSWLPGDNEAAGWQRAREPRRYGPGNLWEHINGAAERYLAYGFQEAASGEYTHRGMGLRATVDVYKMTNSTAAFGVYAEERSPEVSEVAVGAEGYHTGNTLNFRAGPCYVKITASREDPNLPPALGGLAVHVARGIGENGGPPAAFSRFPADNLVPRSFRVVPKDVLGQSYLPLGFEAEYRAAARPWKLVLVPLATADESASALVRYREFLSGSGTPPRAGRAPGEASLVGKDAYYGLVVAARSGPDLAFALGAPNERTAAAALSAVLEERTHR